MQRLLLACALFFVAAPAVAQIRGVERRPVRYLYAAPSREPALRPARVVVVERPVNPGLDRLPRLEPRRDGGVRWFLGAGFGGLALLDGDRGAVPAYSVELGAAVDGVELALHADLAPAFTEADALHTVGAAFRYRFLPEARVHPSLGFGLESLFRHPDGAEVARAFAATAEVGLDLDLPTTFGALSLGLVARAHRGIAGAEAARVTAVGFGAHFALRFR